MKSATLASIFTTAAQPPSFLRPDNLNSLNHTWPEVSSKLLSFVFFTPNIITLTLPKLGLPLIPTLSSPGTLSKDTSPFSLKKFKSVWAN